MPHLRCSELCMGEFIRFLDVNTSECYRNVSAHAMLIQNSLPTSIGAALSFVSDQGKQGDSDLLCDSTENTENLQRCLKCDECPWERCRNSLSMEKDNVANSIGSVIDSRTSSHLLTVDNICESSSPKKDVCVYMRRNLHKNSVALLPLQTETDSSKGSGSYASSISSDYLSPAAQKDDHPDSPIKQEIDNIRSPVMIIDLDLVDSGTTSIGGQCYPEKPVVLPSTRIHDSRGLKVVSESEPINGCSDGEVFPEVSISKDCKSAMKYYSRINDRCPSSKSNNNHGIARKDDPPVSQIKEEIDGVNPPVIPIDLCDVDLLDDGTTSIGGQLHQQKPEVIPTAEFNDPMSLKVISRLEPINGCSVEVKGFAEVSISKENKSALKYYSRVNDRCSSSSKSDMKDCSTFRKIAGDDTGECSSSDVVATEVFGENLSAKELCVSILRRYGLLGGVYRTRACASTEVLGNDVDANCFQTCKICGLSENPVKMLICDLCEGAFHLSCCNPRVKRLPVDDWYCQPCSKKKPKSLLGTSTENSAKKLNRESCPISSMLKDIEPYTSGVRIGKDFQAEVPNWTGPISEYNDFNNIGEPLELDLTDCLELNGWNSNRSSTSSSIGNWLQCREFIDGNTGENSGGIVCGKYRRAPLFEVQTDDWDCSCAVLWDPIHSDCAVPQELPTDEVLKHLKYIELLRPRLAGKKRKLNCIRSDGSG